MWWPTGTDVAHDFSAVADLQGLAHPRSRRHVHQTLRDPSVACEVRQDHAGRIIVHHSRAAPGLRLHHPALQVATIPVDPHSHTC